MGRVGLWQSVSVGSSSLQQGSEVSLQNYRKTEKNCSLTHFRIYKVQTVEQYVSRNSLHSKKDMHLCE